MVIESHLLCDSAERKQMGRSLGHIHLLILKNLLENQEATGTTPGDGDNWQQKWWGSSFYHDVTGAGKHHFGIFLAYWHQGLTLPPNWSAAAVYLQAMQPAMWDPAGQQMNIQVAQPIIQKAYFSPQQAYSNCMRLGLIANQAKSQLCLLEHPQ